MTDLKCMSFLGKRNSEVLVAGCQSVMYKIDVDKGVVVKEVRLTPSVQRTLYLAFADTREGFYPI